MRVVSIALAIACSVACVDREQQALDYMTLALAAGNGHLSQVRDLIERGTPVDSAFGNGSDIERTAAQFVSPLQAASVRGHLEVVSFLLESGAHPDRRGLDGETALFLAAAAGRAAIVEVLLAAGADPRLGTAAGSPLEVARKAGHADVVSALSAPR